MINCQMLNMLRRAKNKASSRELLVHFFNFPSGHRLETQIEEDVRMKK